MTAETFTIDTSEVDALRAELDDAYAAAGADAAEQLVRADTADALEAVRLAASRHHRTGRLERGIQASVTGAGFKAEGTVAATSSDAHFILSGVRAHTIRPLAARALALLGGSLGARAFAGSVRHPGSRPDPFVDRGLASARTALDANLDRSAEQLAEDVAARITEG